MIYFALAGVLTLALIVFHRATNQEPPPAPSVIPPNPVLTIKTTPVLQNGERVFVGLGLEIIRPPDQVEPLALEQVSLWALSLQKAQDAFSPTEYSKLRSFLHFEGVRSVAITTIAPIKNKGRQLSTVEEFIEGIKTLKELHTLEARMSEEFPELWADPTFKSIIERRLQAKYNQFLDPTGPEEFV